MTALDILGPHETDAIAALCRRSLADAPTSDEVAGALFAPDQPTTVRGDPDVGVVVTVVAEAEGYIRLLVVDPAHRRRGHGHALLEAAERDLAGQPSVTVGADTPYFLFPGVETSEIGMLVLLERHHYDRHEANFNMAVDLTQLAPDPGGHTVATPEERDEVDAWMAANWGNWRLEVLRALDKGTLLLRRDGRGISAFCAYGVNRGGLLGPVASRFDLIGKGVAAPLILGALHRMRAEGRDTAEVVWVGPIVPYARVGATVSRVFFVYRRALPPA
ncbi:MAG: GCN5-related N-acetyltransferase [Acidimicrobiales bacterium]|nr:GCN5-related N-acetyltransferase [Acidimicrobiales bacterium]